MNSENDSKCCKCVRMCVSVCCALTGMQTYHKRTKLEEHAKIKSTLHKKLVVCFTRFKDNQRILRRKSQTKNSAEKLCLENYRYQLRTSLLLLLISNS